MDGTHIVWLCISEVSYRSIYRLLYILIVSIHWIMASIPSGYFLQYYNTISLKMNISRILPVFQPIKLHLTSSLTNHTPSFVCFEETICDFYQGHNRYRIRSPTSYFCNHPYPISQYSIFLQFADLEGYKTS